MRTIVSLLAGVTCVLAAAAPAIAEEIHIATDPEPPPPPPEPISDPVAPPEAPRDSLIALATATEARQGRDLLGFGGSVGFSYLERHGDLPSGFDASGVFLRGDNASIYDLSVRLIAAPRIGSTVIGPFVAFGLCAGASRIVVDPTAKDGGVAHGLAIGPSAALGVHGFLGDNVYWRASAGFLGAGVGVLTADVGLGMVLK